MTDSDLAFATALELTQLLREGALSAEELMRETLARIETVDTDLNAVVTRCPERALASARAADARQARGEALPVLHGLPIAHKDLHLTAGLRTTFGSTLLRDFVPSQDDLIVERLRAAGAITVGKTNTPEFGAGSQTFNAVFGATRNPWDRSKTCGGSSGGAAVALAAGLLPIADGSDLGGSLRNPASFCNVVGLRPSPGRVPQYPARHAWAGLAVQGPMARNVADCALLLSAMAGPDPRAPLSRTEPGARFAPPLTRSFRGVRAAWTPDLDGLPVDPRVRMALRAVPLRLGELGLEVQEATPDFSGADEVFQVLRAWTFAATLGEISDDALERVKDTVRWNVERGRALSGDDVARAESERSALYHRVRIFMETHEFLLAPVSQVPPFDVDEPWVREIDGVPMETYIDWMKSCSRITLTGHPAISVPCGFTEDGLPVGVQIVGRHGEDRGVLELAHALEQVCGATGRRPPLEASNS